jgi:hypothetical protein
MRRALHPTHRVDLLSLSSLLRIAVGVLIGSAAVLTLVELVAFVAAVADAFGHYTAGR